MTDEPGHLEFHYKCAQCHGLFSGIEPSVNLAGDTVCKGCGCRIHFVPDRTVRDGDSGTLIGGWGPTWSEWKRRMEDDEDEES